MGAGNREDSVETGNLILNLLRIPFTHISHLPHSDVDWSQEFDRFHDHDKNGNSKAEAVKLKR